MRQDNISVTGVASVGTIEFGALIPARGFRWIYRDEKDNWHLRAPPDDWPEADYRAARLYEKCTAKPELSNRFLLATTTGEWTRAVENHGTDFGKLISKPDLYLRFASERATPALILELANRYGLLNSGNTHFAVERSKASNIETEFDVSKELGVGPHPEILLLTGEKASDWIKAFETARFMVREWSEMSSEGDFKGMESFLENGFNDNMFGSLTYQVHLDSQTGRTQSSIIASSLADALAIQWGISIAANVQHRQCSECPTWFAVHPGSGRPEKQFCSDACRMRAYRQRLKARR